MERGDGRVAKGICFGHFANKEHGTPLKSTTEHISQNVELLSYKDLIKELLVL